MKDYILLKGTIYNKLGKKKTDAIEILKQESLIKYDPKIVNTFINMIQ